jgi:heme exporter protein A
MTELLLEGIGLTVERGGFTLFDPVEVALASGQMLWIEADNGIGKTSLLRALVGLSTLRFEQLRYRGQSFPEARAEFLRHSRLLQHQSGCKSALSVRDNWRFWQNVYGDQQDLAVLAEAFGLSGLLEQSFATLSAGQKKRVQLAVLRFATPPIWLLDEPFANLDQHGVRLVQSLLLTHLTQGGAALCSSHGILGHSPELSARTKTLRLQPAILEPI